jgi:hypothetical protein
VNVGGKLVEIIVDKEYSGPGILELAATIPEIADKTVKLRWANSKDEIHALARFSRNFTLVVPDVLLLDRTIATFGKRLKVSAAVLERAKFVLADKKGYDWRSFIGELRETSPRYLVLKLAADAVRKGVQPSLAEIAGKILSDGVAAADADVLLRLRSPRMRG